MSTTDTIFYIIVVVLSLVVHEFSHGFIALLFGDTTARDAGRLTLNPLKHLDPFGSVLLPIMLAFSGLPIVGWAKPTPVDIRFLRNPKRDYGLISSAGPASNFLLAIIFTIIYRIVDVIGNSTGSLDRLLDFFVIIIITNLALAFFNLIPIPPLDGSSILFAVLPKQFAGFEAVMRQFGFIILIVFILSGGNLILGPLITNTFRFLLTFGR